MRGPILAIHYKIWEASGAKQFKTLPAGAALHRRCGLTYLGTSVFGMTLKTTSKQIIHAISGLREDEWGIQAF